MFGLGIRLALNSGKEALTRLLLTMVAVAVGVSILLAVLADFHAFQTANAKPDWEATTASTSTTGTNDQELWNYTNDIYKGQTIKRLDVAALGTKAPVMPGIASLPKAGQFYASPALITLLDTTPANELGDRFPGKLVGTIGTQALQGPQDLVIYIGYTPAELVTLKNTIRVTQIASHAQTSVWTNYFRYAFMIGGVAFVFPIIVLIGAATRLAAARREERFAALRLIGASSRQINTIASVDAFVSALFGALLGIGLFALFQHEWANVVITNTRFFTSDVTPTLAGYVAIAVIVPLVSMLAALLSLRGVRISPLGVSRKVTPPAPTFRRMIPLLVGIALYLIGVLTTTQDKMGVEIYPGLLIIMVGLIIGGPWMTVRIARILGKRARGASALLASRRLANNPKAAFRTVTGLVLAVFLSTAVAALLPVVNSTLSTPQAHAMSDVLYDGFLPSPVCGNTVNCSGGLQLTVNSKSAPSRGLAPTAATKLLQELRAFKGAIVVPVYANPSFTLPPMNANGPISFSRQDTSTAFPNIVDCHSVAQLAAIGSCPAGTAYAVADGSNLGNDNPAHSTDPIVHSSNPAISVNTKDLYLESVLVKTPDTTTLEKIRTFLATHNTSTGSAPRTYGEAVQTRNALVQTVQRLFSIATALTLFVAGCSLAVTVSGSIIERKRPFSLLRVTGVPITVLYRVVWLEALLPLIMATIASACIGYGIGIAAVEKMAPKGTVTPVPGSGYFLALGTGLALSVLMILVTMPILKRVTQPDNARFE